MKTITKCLVALTALLTIQAPLSAYKFRFENDTGEDLILTVQVDTGISKTKLIMSEYSTGFDFDKASNRGACLSSVKVFSCKALTKQQDITDTSESSSIEPVLAKQQDVTLRALPGDFCRSQLFSLKKENGNYIATRALFGNKPPQKTWTEPLKLSPSLKTSEDR